LFQNQSNISDLWFGKDFGIRTWNLAGIDKLLKFNFMEIKWCLLTGKLFLQGPQASWGNSSQLTWCSDITDQFPMWLHHWPPSRDGNFTESVLLLSDWSVVITYDLICFSLLKGGISTSPYVPCPYINVRLFCEVSVHFTCGSSGDRLFAYVHLKNVSVVPSCFKDIFFGFKILVQKFLFPITF
jgi:hypothetical protein